MKYFIILCAILICACTSSKQPKYKDPALPIEERVNDLIKRMTLEEKVGQLVSYWSRDTISFDENGNFVGGEDIDILNRGVGSFFSFGFFDRTSFRRSISRINSFQKYMLEKTRLGIPALMFSEGLHGAMIPGATSFPQAIGLGSTWDTALVEQVFTVAALEANSWGAWQVLSPVLDLARDPRWGRTEECYSEDPYLASRIGMAAVFGFQGRGETIDDKHVAVTLKHFAGHGQPEGGKNLAPVNYSEREFRETHLYPFEMAVIGPNAADIHLGGYSAVPMRGVSILEGIKAFAAGKFNVLYSEGCKITLNEECNWRVNEKPILNNPENDKMLMAEAVKVAKKSDAVILVIGENELIHREAWSDIHLGDRDDLDLIGMQNELAKAILETGKPTVVLLINGRPITINYLQENAPAIIECWYLGQETGHAVADVIFGMVNPSGKLSVTFPRSVGQLPCFYNKKPTNHRFYVLADPTPLYPFGFGLSYTTFGYENLRISPKEIPVDATAEVHVDITNTGKVTGDEILQLYIHDLVSFPTRPVKELKDFAKITLEPGEKRTVKFTITPEKLEAFDLNMKRAIQPGDFEIMVGKSSVDVLTDTLTVLE